MTEEWNSKIVKLIMPVQKLTGYQKYFDMVMGYWILGYLPTDDIEHLLRNSNTMLKERGCLVLVEIVLKEEEEQVPRLHPCKEQQLMIRPLSSYLQAFERNGFVLKHRIFQPANEICEWDYYSFVLFKVEFEEQKTWIRGQQADMN